MDFNNELNDNGGTIYGLIDNQKVAHLNLHFDDKDLMIISFVFVNPDHRGGGYGAQLVSRAVDIARQRKLKVKPTCSYAAAVMQMRREKYADVLV